jgi:deferrochelatase/peroxidase EfeB
MSLPEKFQAPGVLPDAVIRDPNANAYLFGIDLTTDLDAAGVQQWLTGLTQLVGILQQPDAGGVRRATAVVAFGPSFFGPANQPRFGISPGAVPAGFVSPPPLDALNALPSAAADVLIYVMSTSEATVAAFELGLSSSRGTGLLSVAVECGFQRQDHREPFGFLDGLRNPKGADRTSVVFIDRDLSPEEAFWVEGGSYLVYMKITQNIAAMAALPQSQQESIIGRRKTDGSRIDLPAGTPIAQEGAFADDTCPVNAHIRKTGPRGPLHDETRIFRRGVPFTTINTDGSVDAGLQFVSFQGSLAAFAVIFERWMTNINFPVSGTGADTLQAQSLITIDKAGTFFVPPADSRYIGAGVFDPVPTDPCTLGSIVVQKQLVDTNGQPVLSELGGIAFQILDSNTRQPIGPVFMTDSTGRAVSPDVPRGAPLVVHEVAPPTGFQQAADVPLTLASCRQLITITNSEVPGPNPGPNYSA